MACPGQNPASCTLSVGAGLLKGGSGSIPSSSCLYVDVHRALICSHWLFHWCVDVCVWVPEKQVVSEKLPCCKCVNEWMLMRCKTLLSSRKTGKALYKYSPFIILHIPSDKVIYMKILWSAGIMSTPYLWIRFVVTSSWVCVFPWKLLSAVNFKKCAWQNATPLNIITSSS